MIAVELMRIYYMYFNPLDTVKLEVTPYTTIRCAIITEGLIRCTVTGLVRFLSLLFGDNFTAVLHSQCSLQHCFLHVHTPLHVLKTFSTS